ncbi:unnamed protein product [Mytilus edulis]|uniref:Ig-like domain-containing protein n=1 Tax=Mytilus edulis TaxID=6550 RepID=A0A8S3QK64_MYTED|nr:unnamed protein product [Mytilus edulis]
MHVYYYTKIVFTMTIAGNFIEYLTYFEYEEFCESCIKNETIMFVDPGSDVIIKCVCSNETRGGVTGPVISPLIDLGNSDHLPYTDGSVLNSNLNTAKYMVVVNFNKNECNLKIVKFSREEDGIYKCQYQSMDKIAIHVYTIAMKMPPVFLLENTQYIQYGAYGSEVKLWVEIYSVTKVLSKHIKRYEAKQNIEAYAQEKNVTGHVLFHRMRVTVLGKRLTFKVFMEREEDFNNYTIIVCNIGGCTNMTIEKTSEIHTIVPLEVQYDEIGNINFMSRLQNNARESISSVNLPSLERTSNIISSSEKSSSSNSSEHIQSISLLYEDGYEHPYQTIDLESIELHPYSTICFVLYVFGNDCSTAVASKCAAAALFGASSSQGEERTSVGRRVSTESSSATASPFSLSSCDLKDMRKSHLDSHFISIVVIKSAVQLSGNCGYTKSTNGPLGISLQVRCIVDVFLIQVKNHLTYSYTLVSAR